MTATLPLASTITDRKLRLPIDEPFKFIANARIIETEDGDVVEPTEYSRESECRLQLFRHCSDTSRTIALVTQLDTDLHLSRCFEDVAAQVCLRFGLDPLRVVWIEHHDRRLHTSDSRLFDSLGRCRRERFDVVSFRVSCAAGLFALSDPAWLSIEKSSVEKIIGQKLP